MLGLWDDVEVERPPSEREEGHQAAGEHPELARKGARVLVEVRFIARGLRCDGSEEPRDESVARWVTRGEDIANGCAATKWHGMTRCWGR